MKKKKIALLFVSLICLFGCTFGNTPTKKVERLLEKYQNNSEDIMTELDDYLTTLNIDETNTSEYRKVYKRQYEDLDYEIKEEKIDGDNAVVTVQIEVYDYYKADNDITKYINEHNNDFMENGIYSAIKGLEYKISELLKSTDRVTYTIDFNLSKVDNNWVIDSLTEEELSKLHGTYAH